MGDCEFISLWFHEGVYRVCRFLCLVLLGRMDGTALDLSVVEEDDLLYISL